MILDLDKQVRLCTLCVPAPIFGVGTCTPNEKLTVAGNISANGGLSATGANNYFAGNVGIGDSTPTYKLDVAGTGRFTGHLDVQSTSDFSGALRAYGKIGVGNGQWVDPTEALTVAGNISASGSLSAAGPNNNYFAGNVGIGTASPAANLHVVGDINIEDGYYLKYNNSTNLSILGSSSTGTTYTSLEHHFKAYDGSVDYSEYMTIAQAGKVGIGETNPGEKLTVAGNISASGCVYGNIVSTGTTINGDISANGGLSAYNGYFVHKVEYTVQQHLQKT